MELPMEQIPAVPHDQPTMDSQLSEALFNGVNEQGFVLQEKCVRVMNDAHSETGWHVETTEHPVSLKDQDTRIDIIVVDTTTRTPLTFGVVECKRVDPSYSCWLFGNPLYDTPTPALAQILMLRVQGRASQKVVPVKRTFELLTHTIDNWWIQVNVRRRDERQKYSDPQPIEAAFIQACLGIGGLIDERMRQIPKTIKDGAGEFYDFPDTYFVPIVITTSPLYVSKYDLSNVDIADGRIGKDKLDFLGLPSSPQPVRWLLAHYGARGGITPDAAFVSFHGVDPVDFEPYNRRSIFVVNSKYLTQFLQGLHAEATLAVKRRES